MSQLSQILQWHPNLRELELTICAMPPHGPSEASLVSCTLPVDEVIGDNVVEEAFPFFPLNDVQDFVIQGLGFDKYKYDKMFRKTENISHLQLINPKYVENALNSLIQERRGMLKRMLGSC